MSFEYKELMLKAHELGLESIKVELVQKPDVTNMFVAVCSATLTFQDGRVYTDIGQSYPEFQETKNLSASLVEIASTKAKVRVLNDALVSHEVTSQQTVAFGCQPITLKQIRTILDLSTKLGKEANIKKLTSLSRPRASELISSLGKEVRHLSFK